MNRSIAVMPSGRADAPAAPGWVYVFKNAALPRCVKIGGTSRTATARAAEVEREYGTAAPFKIVRRHAVADWFAVEQATHRMLADRRLPRSELFEVTPSEASRVIKAAALAYHKPWAVTVWLRRLMMPAPPATSRPRWRPRRRAESDAWIWLTLLAAVGLVIWLKPVPPAWLPPGAARAIFTVEGWRL